MEVHALRLPLSTAHPYNVRIFVSFAWRYHLRLSRICSCLHCMPPRAFWVLCTPHPMFDGRTQIGLPLRPSPCEPCPRPGVHFEADLPGSWGVLWVLFAMNQDLPKTAAPVTTSPKLLWRSGVKGPSACRTTKATAYKQFRLLPLYMASVPAVSRFQIRDFPTLARLASRWGANHPYRMASFESPH